MTTGHKNQGLWLIFLLLQRQRGARETACPHPSPTSLSPRTFKFLGAEGLFSFYCHQTEQLSHLPPAPD